MRLLLIKILLFILFCSSFIFLLKPFVIWVDLNFFHESIRDTVSSITTNEDWSLADPLPKDLNSTWQKNQSANKIYLIAHALGDAGRVEANSFNALYKSISKDFKLFEVDISLDESGDLLCYHPPDKTTRLGVEASCTFNKLLPIITSNHLWLIVDIKTNFKETAEKILDISIQQKALPRVIFQLYKPEDLSWFSNKASMTSLNVPIIATYKSQRSANHILEQADRLNIKALSIPASKLVSIRNTNLIPDIFAHPVHNCIDWEDVNKVYKVNGVYSINSINIEKCS